MPQSRALLPDLKNASAKDVLELTKKLNVHATKFSETAKKQIEAAGGTCQEIA